MTQDLVTELQKQNRRLKQLLFVGTLTGASLVLLAAKSNLTHQKFTEIDVERINIVMPDGRKELVIANRLRVPDPVIGGKELKGSRTPRPGLIFYNEIGDENGGLIFDGKLDKSGHPNSGMHFSMDRFGGDQQLSLGHYESGGGMETGLKVYDRGLSKDYEPLWEAYEKSPEGPEKEALLKKFEEAGGRETTRLFVGRTRGKSPAVVLADAQGKPRILMMVHQDGSPVLKFIDDKGKVIQSLPESTEGPGK
ncbi:MAG TPA: hypothetical protein VFO10_17150 [Oligoflexus sp.]|uniref:hypothetical protein n=1 Tax=Oligoflexus sp. TaxID=1971216 RepID=UPI002D7F8397|nr:hypothetical protein [Oligoflexus sp.]HET9238988.1 hypothetical protein [Oligoflexus sp.]